MGSGNATARVKGSQMTEVTKDMKRGIAQLRKIEDGFLSGSLDPEDARQPLQRVIEREFDRTPAQPIAKEALSNPYPVPVNYGRRPRSAVQAGEYDGVNDYYNDMQWSEWKTPDGSKLIVPKRGIVDKELSLFHIGAYFGEDYCPISKEIRTALVKEQLIAVTVYGLLAFGEKYLNVQREFPVIALGSVWFGPGGGRHVAVLEGDAGGRHLDLGWDDPDDQWSPRCRVLVSRA